MKLEIKKIIQELKETIHESELVVSHDMLFDKSISIYLTEVNQGSKKEYKKDHLEKEYKPMTEKQEKYIRDNDRALRESGFDIDNIQDRKQAIKIINEFIKLKKKDIK